MIDPTTAEALITRAKTYADADFQVRDAIAKLDALQDGEPIIRMTLLLTDPEGDTWSVDQIRELRMALGRNTVELGAPQ